MNIDFNVYEYDYKKRDGNLEVEAQGVVKSQKFFPYFYEKGQKNIFKPLSKTKPLSTPYFAYSEVVWSNIIHNYFDDNTPIYHLAKCINYEEENPKYHNYGTIVESIVKNDEQLINLYEYFNKFPDEQVDIKNYINYCLVYYDYSFFFETKLFKENSKITLEIAKQILYSILRADQNYHYENVSLIYNANKPLKVASPIDHEFSAMFMYLDDKNKHNKLLEKYYHQFEENLTSNMSNEAKNIFELLNSEMSKIFESNIIKNIKIIAKNCPDLVENFITTLNILINDLNQSPINLENNNYIEPFNSNDYEEGILRYKENNIKEADKKLLEIEKRLIMPEEINDIFNQEIINCAKILKRTLEKNL